MSRLRFAILLAGCFALPCGSAHAAHRPTKKPAKVSAVKLAPLQEVGVSDNLGMYDSPDPGQPAATAQRIAGLGMNAERVYVHWNPDAPYPTADQQRQLCNAAAEAALHGINHFILAVPPPADRQPMPDPQNSQYNSFWTTWTAYFADLYDAVGGCVSGNSYRDGVQVPKLADIEVEPLNESNIDTFCSPQTDTTHDLCADLAVQLRAFLYPKFKELGQQYGVQVTVIGGALSSHHDPGGYIQAECTAMQRHGITSPNMDEFGFHPYQLPGSSNFLSGFMLFQKLQPLIRKCYGSLPFIFDEAGQETQVPSNMGYTGSTPGDLLPYLVTDSQRAWNYQLMLALARKLGATGVLFFLLQDEQNLNPGWQSGFYYWNGQPKPYLTDMAQAIQKARGLS